MHYNLLNYGNDFGDCNSNNNNVNTKNEHLKKIVNYVKPDIFTVNELSDNTIYHQLILNNVLNIEGETKYKKAVSFNFANSNIVNMLYYNSEKLVLHHQDVVTARYRDIDVYTLYYKSGDLAETNDTLFLRCLVAHLKAGNSSSDAADRATMVSNAISYLRLGNDDENLLFIGDLNLYSSNEQAYINLTYSYEGKQYFFDPINREGNWNNNSNFKDVHTQSTHAGNTDCFSSGGLDDRFDFIMTSSAILDGSYGIQILPESYKALGNDAQHYNNNINDAPTNTSAPSEIIDALFGMSDHLPVLAKLRVEASLGLDDNENAIGSIIFPNPNNGNFSFEILPKKYLHLRIKIIDVLGRIRYIQDLGSTQKKIAGQINLEYFSNGIYFFVVEDQKGNQKTKKFVLKK